MLPQCLPWLDEASRADRCLVGPDDHCLFFGKYRARTGWRGGAVNDLILDFKRRPEEIARSDRAHVLRYFNERALVEVAQALRPSSVRPP